eukprot:CAMPEP_0174256494 /NCGR_PEP_ID=MMETSP0439-20130205/5715_1 /TAXON_ID=0 /ORGANISM="Stereomyxa ramosa, Strain Chinc5" /LENGTH=208 /DNA_ID=CAMNT_0015339117 /DNA_START=308 /DNA_END=934 /DNA_ORIENTATION=+
MKAQVERSNPLVGGVIPYKSTKNGVFVLLGERNGVWSPFSRTAEKDEDVKEAALRAFHFDTGINPSSLQCGDKSVEDRVKECAVRVHSELDNQTHFLVDASEGFPTVSCLKEDRKKRGFALARATVDGNAEEQARLSETVKKCDFRWVCLDTIKTLCVYDTTYYAENLECTCSLTGESFIFDKTLINILKENNTWGGAFLEFARKVSE